MFDFKIFTTTDQDSFATLTGDFNPIHMDPIAARRTQAGAPVVHGIHTLLWLLDFVGARHADIRNAATLKVRFSRMLYLGDRVEPRIVESSATSLRAQACVDGLKVIDVVVGLGSREPVQVSWTGSYPELTAKHGAPSDLALQDMENRAGRVAFGTEAAEIEKAFPGAVGLLGRGRVAALGCSTYLIGMVVPGLHSIYDGLDLTLDVSADPPHELRFEVTEVDPRFRRVRIQVEGGGLSGLLAAFSRVPPVSQSPMVDVAKHVARGEFNESVALIVGGSRGLGELTAKIIAAGGGRAIVTYASGRPDADRLAAEIADWGGRCDVIPYDVRREAEPQLDSVKHVPTHLYYFATPSIFRRKAGLCSRERFEEFNEFYIHGFLRLVEAIMRRAPEEMTIFYPSSVAVQDRPRDMTEYAMSKAAGEILCAEIANHHRNVRVLTERLPRLSTDQTASLIEVQNADALSVMLPIVRRMHERLASHE